MKFCFPFNFFNFDNLCLEASYHKQSVICMVIPKGVEVAFQNAVVQLCALHNLLTLTTADYTSFS